MGRKHADKKPRTIGRTLHLVDADNLLRDPETLDDAFIADVLFAYRRASQYQPGDQVVVASNPHALHAAALHLAWPGVTHRWRGGDDGADLELLEAASWAASTQRFDRVVLGSGDRIFLAALDELRGQDVTVDVVGRRGNMATAMAVRSGGVHYVDDVMRRRIRDRAEHPLRHPA